MDVAARPEAVQKGLFGLPTAGAYPLVRIGGGPLGPPDVVSDNVSEGLGFFDRAIGEEASSDGLDAGEVGGLAVP